MPSGIYIRTKPSWNKGKKGLQTAWNKGKIGLQKHSEETRRKMSETHKKIGSGKWMAGRHFSEEFKQKLSKSAKRAGTGKWMTGKFASKESKKKMSEAHRGNKSYRWKGGVTPLVLQIRHCFKCRQWRSDIFTRDDFTCVVCGKRGGYLEADHYPKSFAEIFHRNKIKTLEQALECEEFWNINNGRTLCLGCHNKTKDNANKKKNS